MKTLRFLLAAAAALFTASLALAGNPTGTWKWTQQGRQGGQGFERTLRLELKDGQLTGTVLGTQGGQFQIPDLPIADASFKDDTVSFTVTFEFNGNKRTTKYSGKVEGDTLTGSIESTNRNGEPVKRDWSATRAK